MADADNLLLAVLRHCQGDTLFVADENCLDFPFASLAKSLRVISNRCDVAAQAEAAGLTSRFADYDLAAWQTAPVDHVVYRLSKEKPVVHHIANQALQALKHGGQLHLIGGKQEGIKTFAKTISGLFGCTSEVAKEGQLYVTTLTKQATNQPPLDDRDYDRLREITTLAGQPLLSKPGLFGWDKIDTGSELLANHLDDFLQNFPPEQALSLLDLGCGYGYLSLMAHHRRPFSITATDNCAAALIACAANFQLRGIDGQVLAADCGAGINQRFDVLLCNPPFHQGFQQDRRLTEKFLDSTKRLLKPTGRAMFVVNQFVPLESLAAGRFKAIAVPLTAKGFKLVALAL